MNPLVSILIPAYNAEKWVKDTIENSLAQTWGNKEVIVVDDGSTDKTYHIAKQYESRILKVLTQKNSGACVARNRALSIAQGDFIQWLDADDLLAQNKIKQQLLGSDKSSNSRVLHSASWGYFYYRISKTKFKGNKLWQDLSPSEWLSIHLGEGFYIPSHAWLVSRKLTELTGPWDERLKRNQDGEYFNRVVMNSELIKFHSSAKCFYRKGSIFSISMTRSKSVIESLNLSNNLCVDYLLSMENNDTTREACIKFLQRFLNKIPNGDPKIILSNRNRIISLGGQYNIPIETKKFSIFKNILGINTARLLKRWLWNSEIILRKTWDKLLAFLTEEKVKF